MKILFSNADIITMLDEQPTLKGYVLVDGEKIAHVGQERPAQQVDREVDCTGKILMPGLVNTHAHTAMCLMRGYADDYALQEWLFNKVFPVEARLTERAVLAGVQLGFLEMLRTGTTSISDMYFFQPAVASLAERVGMRVSLCNGVVALGEDYDPEKDRAVHETRELIQHWHGASGGRIRADLCIHAEYTSRPEIWRMVLALGGGKGLNMHLHLSETKKEHDECVARYGKTPAAMFEQEGVFELNTIAAHCVWVTEDDMELMARCGVSCAHNPVSNLKLGSGIARVGLMREHGVNVSLGTDGCCSNNTHDMFEEIKLAALLAKGTTLNPQALCAFDALKLATVNGAKAQGRADIGVISPGMQADIILLDMSVPEAQPVYDPVGAVVYGATGERVCFTMVQGKVLYENGVWHTLDAEAVLEEVKNYALPLVRGEITA